MSRKIAVPVPSGVRSLVDTSMQRGSEKEGEWIIPCRLITPLFGGGHTAGENDPVTPISANWAQMIVSLTDSEASVP